MVLLYVLGSAEANVQERLVGVDVVVEAEEVPAASRQPVDRFEEPAVRLDDQTVSEDGIVVLAVDVLSVQLEGS